MTLTQFTLKGRRYELSSDMVEARLAGVSPETIREHAVRVGDTWYPVKQAFEVAVGVSRAEFISHEARRHLAALGFEVHGQIVAREPKNRGDKATVAKARPSPSSENPQDREWHTEATVQAAVVTALATARWRVLSVANTATRERGVDVVAFRDGETVGIEVKGFPSQHYADPARAGETKPTRPSTQAGHWYAQAILAAMRLRGKEPAWRSVIALPAFSRYQDLHRETQGSLDAAQIEVWWVEQDGSVSLPGGGF